MSPVQENQLPPHLQKAVLHAIQRALKEEKEPHSRRIIKVLGATLGSMALLCFPFFLSFREQLSWTWGVAWGLWGLCLLIGFSLHFYPQPRLMVPGFISPFILARILIIATVSTILQVMLCPSYVFLSSPLNWNPLSAFTHTLMGLGGMNLCMMFCGFIFSFVSSIFSLSFVSNVTAGVRIKALLPILGLLLSSQIPILAVQLMSEDLRDYAGAWSLGLLIGSIAGLALIRLHRMLLQPKEA